MTDLDPPGFKAPDPLAPATSGPLALRDRVIEAATFEALTPKRSVTGEFIDFHRRPGAGGVGMTMQNTCVCAVYGGTHCVLDPKSANPPVPA